MKKPSAVIDTNIFISALILPQGKPNQLIQAWKRNKFILIFSVPLIKEVYEVLKRPKYSEKYHISAGEMKRLLLLISNKARLIQSITRPEILIRDMKDLIVLATATSGKADYLVTGDKDLLVLQGHRKLRNLKIVTVSEMVLLLK